MAEYQKRVAELDAAGAGVVAVSVDEPARSEALRRRLGLSFPILSDVDRRVAEAWGLYNAREMGGIFVPATFVLAPSLEVRFAATEGVGRRVGVADVLAFLGPGHAAPSQHIVVPGVRHFGIAITNMVSGPQRRSETDPK